MKIRPLGDQLFHADGWTDGQTHEEANIRFFAILRMSLKSCAGKLREWTKKNEAKNKNYTVNGKKEERGKIGVGGIIRGLQSI